ncbi:dTDP-4-dehydrorhamnose reductase [Streptomyces echinoruber]|uniref:dTDP-4-dehydrorhamnose reductase n=2 Tax=Streptomyces TaxID=1883 RepID=A0A918VH57_9ACTN|nr:dTDP-4-dehydrorhamnose reductase [Streptomyces echinoruber]GGZ97343.1 NAD(P)-dependent oxidoreductase [Streptomyces echinoruber]
MRKAIWVPGGRGQVGTELARVCPPENVLVAPTSHQVDITDPKATTAALGRFAAAAREFGLPPVVVNAAAYTDADAAESDERRAFRVNALGAGHLAAACREHGVPLIYLSTDYVFDGTAAEPYEASALANPLNAYGRTKLAGERAVLNSGAEAWVVRTAWVYSTHSVNFVRTMARLERERDEVAVVDDQTGSPTSAADLASGLLSLAGRVAEGAGPAERVLHYVNTGRASWYELARTVFGLLGADPRRVRPCTSAEFGRPARRPAYSVLSVRAWAASGLPAPRPWQAALPEVTAALRAERAGEGRAVQRA